VFGGREAETLPRIVGSADDQSRIDISINRKLNMADFEQYFGGVNIYLCICLNLVML
jgi:hypothetical protein